MKDFNQEILKFLIRKNYYNIDTDDIKFNQIYNLGIRIVSEIEIPHTILGYLELKVFTQESDYFMMLRDRKLNELGI